MQIVSSGCKCAIPCTQEGSPMTTATSFAAVFVTLFGGHQVGDFWVQTDRQAAAKVLPGWRGRRACAAHVATYTVTTAAFVGGGWWWLHLSITPWGFVLGQAVSAVTHYVADRRTLIARLADMTGSGVFCRLGKPREGHDDNPTLGTGAYALDQAWHWVWLLVAAGITAGVA